MKVVLLTLSESPADAHVFSTVDKMLEYVAFWFLTPSEFSEFCHFGVYNHENYGIIKYETVEIDAGMEYIYNGSQIVGQ